MTGMPEFDWIHAAFFVGIALLVLRNTIQRSDLRTARRDAALADRQGRKSDADLSKVLDLVERAPDLTEWEAYQVYLVRDGLLSRQVHVGGGWPAPQPNTLSFDEWRKEKEDD